jgi:hypothetical protein
MEAKRYNQTKSVARHFIGLILRNAWLQGAQVLLLNSIRLNQNLSPPILHR